MSTLCAAINQALSLAPKPAGCVLPYGTAGFRCEPPSLRHATIRCGMLAVLRSATHGGLPVGICVTASHNPAADNGVKIVEPDGGMLAPAWEQYAAQLANSSTPFDTLETIVLSALQIQLQSASEDYFRNCRVVLARDTRPSSPELSELVRSGILALGAQLIDIGIATTPQLHWTVATCHDDVLATSRAPAEFIARYNDFWLDKARAFRDSAPLTYDSPLKLICDAACGVGGPAMVGMRDAFEVFGCEVIVRNAEASIEVGLNDHCGAEHVQKTRQLPRRFGRAHGDKPGQACVSLDGDADRVVFFVIPEKEDGPLTTIIDGDRIGVIMSLALLRLISNCLEGHSTKSAAPLSFGVVQTAYANGGSTTYLRDRLPLPDAGVTKSVVIAKTGVKNVHHAAGKFDIGVYFESNGHGTVTYKRDRIIDWAREWGLGETEDFRRLMAFLELINDCVGDAIVDALVFVAAMRLLKFDIQSVLNVYADLQVCQAKVAMPRSELNRLKSQPDHELFLVEPVTLQKDIDDLVAKQPNARAFVRASGTEDACRIYVEAPTHEAASKILRAVQSLLECRNF